MSVPLKSGDPAEWMLHDGFTSSTTVFNENCYICQDPEFAQMGLPLCYPCMKCGAHVPADDTVCDNGHEQPDGPISTKDKIILGVRGLWFDLNLYNRTTFKFNWTIVWLLIITLMFAAVAGTISFLIGDPLYIVVTWMLIGSLLTILFQGMMKSDE